MRGTGLALVAFLAIGLPSVADELGDARALVDRREYAQAIGIYDRLVAAEPASSDLAIERARVLGYADRNAASAEAYAAIARGFPERRDDVLQPWAWQRMWSGDAAGATPMFAEVLAGDPSDTKAQLGLAQSLLWSDHPGEAVAAFDAVLAADPGSSDARVGLANALNFSGRPREAVRQFATLLPTTDQGLAFQAARAYYWAGFPEQALPLLAGTTLPQGQWLRDYRVGRERLPYVSGSFDWSDDSDHSRVITAGAVAGWRFAAADTVEASVRSTWIDGPDTSTPANDRYSVDGQQALLTWSGRLGQVDSPWGVAWPTLSAGVRDYGGWSEFAWRARIRFMPIDRLSVTASGGNGAVETVGAIRNEIGYADGTLAAEGWLSTRWLLAGSVSRFDFDRGNNRNQGTLRAEYLLAPARRLRVGVDTIYFSDSEPSGRDHPDLGYWNPDRYSEERLYMSVSRQQGAWDIDGRASVGYYQERDGWGNDNSGPTFQIEGAATYDFSPGLQLRLYAGASSSGAAWSGGGAGYSRTYAGVALTGWF